MHETARTGAPTLLLNFLKNIKDLPQHKVSFLVKYKGDLQEEFATIGSCYDWNKVSRKYDHLYRFSFKRIYYSFFHRGNAHYLKNFLDKHLKSDQQNIILCNSVATAEFIKEFKIPEKWHLVTVVHEPEYLLKKNNQNKEVDILIEKSEKVICISQTVINNLRSVYGDSSKYALIRGGISVSPDEAGKMKRPDEKIKSDFNLLCVGYLDWNKGIDLFIQLAVLLKKNTADIYLTWVGADLSNPVYAQMEYDINRLGLSDRVRILPKSENIFDCYHDADLVLILSRNESLSLTALECSSIGVPFLCFEGCGGPSEIIENDTRFIVPYLDITQMLQRIEYLKTNRTALEEMRSYACKLVSLNYDISVSADLFGKHIFNY